MNDSEIIKVLECCVQNTREACVECPIGFEGRDLCLNVAMEEAIDLINRQKAEIERLTGTRDTCPMDFCGILCRYSEELIAKAKTEAYNELAERLKIFVIPQKADGYTREIVLKSNIDNLIKEMTEAK